MHCTTSTPNLGILIELGVFTVVKFPCVHLEEEFGLINVKPLAKVKSKCSFFVSFVVVLFF